MRSEKMFYFLLFLITFTEGFLLLAFELTSQRIISVYFGSSLYVWSGIIGITMLGLAIGYFIGGRLSEKNNLKTIQYVAVIPSFIFLLGLHLVSGILLEIFSGFELFTGLIIATIVLFLPFFVFLGTIPPLLISYYNKFSLQAGKATGYIYSVSTIGAILSAIFFGIYLIPYWGVNISIYLQLILLIILNGILFILQKL